MDNYEEDEQVSVEYAIKRSLLSKSKLAIIITGSDGKTQYCCIQCPVRCDVKEKLELHLLAHNKEYKYLCGICGTGLKRKEHLDRHTQEHQEVRPYICPECGKAFKRKEHLNIHHSVHSPAKTFTCSLCHKTFHRKDHLTKHLQTHNKIFVESNLQALTDQEMFAFKQEIMDPEGNQNTDDSGQEIDGEVNEHQDYQDVVIKTEPVEPQFNMSAKKFNSERPFACALCDKTYKRKDHLKLHSWTHMKKDKVCSVCGKAFHRDEQLMMHMNTHIKSFDYGNREESLESSYSTNEEGDHMTDSNNDLLVIRSSKANSESRPHECHVCHRRFKRKQHLMAHASVHSKKIVSSSNSIWCSLCIEGFNTNEEFENHECMQSHDTSDDGDSETPLMLPQQEKKENKHPVELVQVDLGHSEDAHFAVMRDERNIPVPRRVFVCKFCAKPFKRKDHYKIHLNIHTGVKSFFCPECGKGFYRKDHMQKHVQVHLKMKKIHKTLPDLYPIKMLKPEKQIKPEITIHAPSNAKLRVPLQMKVPYQMVIETEEGERSVTINPQTDEQLLVT